MSDPVAEFSTRRNEILERIAAAAKAAGRAVADIQLVGISKKQADERIEAALKAGLRVFGENRVQEAEVRWADRKSGYPDLELRLVGPLQTNKVEQAVALFDVIETLDRPKLAEALQKAAAKTGRMPRLYVQVNTGEEEQKSGVVPQDASAFINQLRTEFGFEIEGLMCIPPVDEPAGPHFALLADLAAANGVEKLSMGMSGDYDTAVKFGATSVRVGSALFGARLSA